MLAAFTVFDLPPNVPINPQLEYHETIPVNRDSPLYTFTFKVPVSQLMVL